MPQPPAPPPKREGPGVGALREHSNPQCESKLMDITERYMTQDGRQFLIRLSYNERIKDADPNTAFIRSLDVTDRETNAPVSVPASASKFSTYENFTNFGGYAAINYFGSRETAIEGLRAKILTRVEDYLERMDA